jgi:catechol-2,3-dioxygenase
MNIRLEHANITVRDIDGMMAPKISGIDHLHVYVSDRAEAEHWYASVLGFRRVEELLFWAADNGPLTMENPQHTVHLALFERKNHPGNSVIAFGVDGESFLEWKTYLQHQGLDLRISDHQIMYSMYFSDPYGNLHEITSADYKIIVAGLESL